MFGVDLVCFETQTPKSIKDAAAVCASGTDTDEGEQGVGEDQQADSPVEKMVVQSKVDSSRVVNGSTVVDTAGGK